MKITANQLKQIIREEVRRVVREMGRDEGGPEGMSRKAANLEKDLAHGDEEEVECPNCSGEGCKKCYNTGVILSSKERV